MVKYKVEGAQAVQRAMAIFDLLSPARPSILATEVARELGLARPTAHRLLSALKASGYLHSDDHGRYYLGARVLYLAKTYAKTHTLRNLARPRLEALVAAVNETAALFVREGSFRYCIERVESSHSIRVMVDEGQGLPLGRGAAGRLLLLPPDEAHRVDALVSKGERIPNAWGVAAGVFDESGGLAGVLELSGPLDRFSPAKQRRYARLLAGSARGLSEELGFRPVSLR